MEPILLEKTPDELHTALFDLAKTCEACSLHACRKKVVFSKGPINSKVMIIAEAPGKEEDEQGIPFVGKSGTKVTEWLKLAGLKDPYFTNVVKCRPKDNKFVDTAGEVCSEMYIKRQFNIVKPAIVVLVGRQALHYTLLQKTNIKADPFSPWVGKQLRRRDMFGETRFIPIFHPAYIMRSNNRDEEEQCLQGLQAAAMFIESREIGTDIPAASIIDIEPKPIVPAQSRTIGKNVRAKLA